jgi:hypothetical protein
MCAIATAAHVIDHAFYWDEPVRVRVAATGETTLLRPPDRAILVDAEHDTAVLLFEPKTLSLPSAALPLIADGKILKVGVPVGWLGFPSVAPTDLCFFRGDISAWNAKPSYYLVDGVAINGVSGGPAFSAVNDPMIIGVVSAYMPNRATGETLPGLCVVRDVVQLQGSVKNFASLDDAQAEQVPPTEPPPPPPSPPGAVGPSSNPRC